MNQNQKIVIWVGLGLILLSGLFPTYEGEWRRTGDNYKKYLGYYFLLSPPTAEDIAKGFDIDLNRSYASPQLFNANILFNRFLIQIIVILILSIGLILLFADPKYERKFPITRNDH